MSLPRVKLLVKGRGGLCFSSVENPRTIFIDDSMFLAKISQMAVQCHPCGLGMFSHGPSFILGWIWRWRSLAGASKTLGTFIHTSREMRELNIISFSLFSLAAVRQNWLWNIWILMTYSAFAIHWAWWKVLRDVKRLPGGLPRNWRMKFASSW